MESRNQNGKPPCVLLLDDDLPIRKLMEKVLISRGVSARSTGSEAEAFKLLQIPEVKLLIQDFTREPGTLGGLRFWQRMRSSEVLCDIPVIIISGTSEDYIVRAFAAEYPEPISELVILCPKPFSIEEFDQLIPTVRLLMDLF